MRDLLYDFHNPCVMDIKMGTRTFLESEVSNTKARADLYEKVSLIFPSLALPCSLLCSLLGCTQSSDVLVYNVISVCSGLHCVWECVFVPHASLDLTWLSFLGDPARRVLKSVKLMFIQNVKESCNMSINLFIEIID